MTGSPFNFALHVAGDAMEPEFTAGDEIFVDYEKNPNNGSFVVAQLTKQSPPLFRQFIIDKGKMFLKSLNPQYPAIEVAEDTLIRGVVVYRGRAS